MYGKTFIPLHALASRPALHVQPPVFVMRIHAIFVIGYSWLALNQTANKTLSTLGLCKNPGLTRNLTALDATCHSEV